MRDFVEKRVAKVYTYTGLRILLLALGVCFFLPVFIYYLIHRNNNEFLQKLEQEKQRVDRQTLQDEVYAQVKNKREFFHRDLSNIEAEVDKEVNKRVTEQAMANMRQSDPALKQSSFLQTVTAALDRPWGLAAFIVACLLAWSASAVRVSNPTGNGLEVAGNILSGIFHPSAKLLLTLGTDGVPYLLLETFCIAFLGTIVGAVISLPLSFLSASNLVPRGVALVGRVLIAAIRTIPAFVYGLMFIRVTGPGPFAGLLTMSLCSIGMVSKMFIESIEDLDKRILESLDAAGCTTFQKIRYGILPQLTADFTSTIIYRFDMNLRDATVLGLVGAGGIGAPLIFAMSSYRWNEVGAILLGLIVLVLIIEWISAKIRVKLARG